MKIRYSFFIISILIAFVSCGDATDESTIVETDTSVKAQGFDWSIDPLTVSIDEEGLVSEMNSVDLDTISSHIYNYFHLQQTGDSADYVKHFDYYPSIFDSDTMKNLYAETTVKWWNKGYRNVFEDVSINYASDWVYEEDQRVAIVGFDLVFRTEFTMEYPSDPKRLIETLQRQMPRAELDYIDEEPIRSIVAYDVKGLFVYCDLDSYDFAFISEDEGRGNALDSIMLSDTRLKLLRDKRLALKED